MGKPIPVDSCSRPHFHTKYRRVVPTFQYRRCSDACISCRSSWNRRKCNSLNWFLNWWCRNFRRVNWKTAAVIETCKTTTTLAFTTISVEIVENWKQLVSFWRFQPHLLGILTLEFMLMSRTTEWCIVSYLTDNKFLFLKEIKECDLNSADT